MKKTEATFIETPKGIFTAAGNWFYTTVEKLRSYAPGLFRKHSVEEIITDAEVWIRSADSLSITLFMFTLFVVGIEAAVIVTLLFLPFWHLNKSAFINYSATKLMKLIDKEAFLILLSVMVLSWMGMTGQYVSLVVGLFFFLVLKFGGYRKLVESYYRRKVNKIPLNDRILKMVVLRYAMYEDVNVEEVRKMEADVLNMISKYKK
ncbi:MAG: hypothetical protein WEB89_05960 [Balneolales bacterium]